MRIFAALLLPVLCAGCVTTETVAFKPTGAQQAIVRDGNPAIVSRKTNSIVMVRPASRQFQSGGRPAFVVAITNLGHQPMDFHVGDVAVTQDIHGQLAQVKVVTYEQLVQEERARQVMAAVLTGVATGANAYSASRAGYYHNNSTVVTRHGGVYNVHTTGYSPTAAAIAQSNANFQNEAMISATIERGQQNMAALEHAVIKDNTVMPGEWYGGTLHLAPLASDDTERKHYTIALRIGSDLHEINVEQGAAKQQ